MKTIRIAMKAGNTITYQIEQKRWLCYEYMQTMKEERFTNRIWSRDAKWKKKRTFREDRRERKLLATWKEGNWMLEIGKIWINYGYEGITKLWSGKPQKRRRNMFVSYIYLSNMMKCSWKNNSKILNSFFWTA